MFIICIYSERKLYLNFIHFFRYIHRYVYLCTVHVVVYSMLQYILVLNNLHLERKYNAIKYIITNTNITEYSFNTVMNIYNPIFTI